MCIPIGPPLTDCIGETAMFTRNMWIQAPSTTCQHAGAYALSAGARAWSWEASKSSHGVDVAAAEVVIQHPAHACAWYGAMPWENPSTLYQWQYAAGHLHSHTSGRRRSLQMPAYPMYVFHQGEVHLSQYLLHLHCRFHCNGVTCRDRCQAGGGEGGRQSTPTLNHSHQRGSQEREGVEDRVSRGTADARKRYERGW